MQADLVLAWYSGAGRLLHHRTRSLPVHFDRKTCQTYHPSLLQQIPSHLPSLLRTVSPSTTPDLFAVLNPLEAKIRDEWPIQPNLSTPSSLESKVLARDRHNLHSPVHRTTTIQISCTAPRHRDRCPLRAVLDLEKEMAEEVRSMEQKVWGAGDSPGESRSR